MSAAIANDCSSTMINGARITSMRVLIDLFEQYNHMMIVKEAHATLDDLN